MNKQLIRVKWRAIWFDAVERWFDFWNIALPVFLVTGLIGVCARFWLWLLF